MESPEKTGRFIRVPGYPVYYNPRGDLNYFFYDGLYWVFDGDNWYASSWYDGPWDQIDPYYVPVYVLRIPVRYYHRPPTYFRGWRADAPPRWDVHWGRDWSRRHPLWNQWDRKSAPPPAPLPSYQRGYSGERYPHEPEQRQSIRSKSYRYEPHETLTQQYWQRERTAGGTRAEQQRSAAKPQSQEHHPEAARPETKGKGRDNATTPQGKGRKKEHKAGKGPDDKQPDERKDDDHNPGR